MEIAWNCIASVETAGLKVLADLLVAYQAGLVSISITFEGTVPAGVTPHSHPQQLFTNRGSPRRQTPSPLHPSRSAAALALEESIRSKMRPTRREVPPGPTARSIAGRRRHTGYRHGRWQ